MRRRASFPALCLPPTELHRLAAGLALSLAYHLLLLAVGGHPPSSRRASRDTPPLIVAWRPTSSAAATPRTAPRAVDSAPSAPVQRPSSNNTRAPLAVAPRSLLTPERTQGAETESTAPSRPEAARLVDQARQQIVTESRRQMLDPMFAPPPLANLPTTPSALARALAPGEQRIERLADGMVRVTASNGRQYCLQAIPKVASRGLPAPPTSVPMNCP